jgi:hypothetical protein
LSFLNRNPDFPLPALLQRARRNKLEIPQKQIYNIMKESHPPHQTTLFLTLTLSLSLSSLTAAQLLPNTTVLTAHQSLSNTTIPTLPSATIFLEGPAQINTSTSNQANIPHLLKHLLVVVGHNHPSAGNKGKDFQVRSFWFRVWGVLDLWCLGSVVGLWERGGMGGRP